jgi:hypothetical protein
MNPQNSRQSTLWRKLAISALGLAIVPFAWSQDANEDEQVFELSPFEVDGSGDVGYYAQNTLAGTRLNTSIADLASSITVVTLEQMEDTAALDINDVFQYEANTEGANTYTEGVATSRQDGLLDTNAGGAQGGDMVNQGYTTANRIRGIGRPGTTVNYYQALATVPFDVYNTGSVEINRGPNSLLFGMGNPAGIVNQSTAIARFGKDLTRVQLRVDDRGSFRASLRFNKELIDDKLAIFGAFLNDDRDFERKPSYDDTTRAYGSITLKPFKKTTIRASAERYSNDNRRPNTISPRDTVSEWRSGGRWTYNPVTGRLISKDTGETRPLSMINKGPRIQETRDWIKTLPGYDANLWNNPANPDASTKYNGANIFGASAVLDPNSVLFTPGMGLGGHAGNSGNSRPIFRIVDGNIHDYTYWRGSGQGNYRLGFGTETNPAGNAPKVISNINDVYNDTVAFSAYDTSWTNSHMYSGLDKGVLNYLYPGVTDRSIYDYEKINALQMNFGEKNNTTYNLELEQELLPDLILNLGFFQQDYEEITSYTISQLNTATIYVDTNTHKPDGTVNELFGLPFMAGPNAPDQFKKTTLNETSRAMLAWTPDFTGNEGWTKWLGRHQAIGLVSKYNTLDGFWRKRWYITDSDEGINKVNIFERNPNVAGYKRENRSVKRLWYLANPGDPQDGSVTRGSGEWNNSSYEGQMQYFNYTNNAWQSQRYGTGYIDHSAHTGRKEREVESISLGLTSFLWNDRLITTVGWREDDYQARETTSGPIVDQDGNQVEPAMTNQEKWIDGLYDTETVFNRWNRWDALSGQTSTVGAVLRPFDNWSGIQSEFLKSFGFSYNKSDNFNPPTAAQIDYFGNPLPKPTGTGEDWGIQFSLFDNKLFTRLNWFKATNENERTNTGTVANRVNLNVDEGQFRGWAERIALINTALDMGILPTDEEFGNLKNDFTPAQLDQLEADTAEIWGFEYDRMQSLPGTVSGTRTAEAEGWELEIVYNPTRNWTIKVVGAKQETIYNEVMKEYDAWIAFRGPAWDGARGADYLDNDTYVTYNDFNGREINLTDFWNSYGYTSQVTGEDPLTANQQAYWDKVVTPQVSLGKDLQGQASKGQRKYRGTILTNYKFTDGRLAGLSVGGSLRWEDSAVIGYYGKVNEGSGSDLLALADVTRPIYDSANTRVDLWCGYNFRMPFMEEVNAKVKLNVVNAFEGGRLQVVAVNYNGDPYGYRIIDPRQFILTLDLDF